MAVIVNEHQDAFGQEIFAYYSGKDVTEIVERDDGYIGASSGPANYFAEFNAWPAHQREAIGYAKGHIFDIGCGAGRASLFLQDKGYDVLALDNSPLAIKVCQLRGVKRTILASITQINSRMGMFDTILMFGNNFGLFGNPTRARWLLRRFHRLTSPDARIIAESNHIYLTEEPIHLAYHQRNRSRGKMAGQVRIRIRYQTTIGPWFDYLFVSPDEMKDLLVSTGWRVDRFIPATEGPMYIGILMKD